MINDLNIINPKQNMNLNQMRMMNMNPMPAMNMNPMPAMNMNRMPAMNMNPMPAMNMNPMEMINKINALSVENKSLENKLKDLEKKFQDYQNKIESILFYNEIDPNSYTLDSVFDNLESNEIIKNKEEIRLINKGIKYLFNKNIISFECKYQSKAENFNPYNFKQIFNNINYALIAVVTKYEEQRFGAFCIYNHRNNFNNMNNLVINFNGNDIIFNSKSCLDNSFIFSLDTMNNYYKMNYTLVDTIPNFNLIYNTKHESLLGQEFPINNSPFKKKTANPSFLDYKLTGKQEFKVKYLELYEILI